MFPCQDPVLIYLNGLGYNVVRLPRSGILPLEVLGRKGREKPGTLGQIGTIWKSDGPTPAAAEDTATSVNGGITKSLKLSLGIKFLENILPALGIDAASARVTYKHASSLRFRFGKPKVLKVDPLIVGQYLRAGDIDLDNPLAKYFMNEVYHAYVITEVLQSKAITVTAEDNLGEGIDVGVPQLGGAAKVEAGAETSTSTKGTLTYTGTQDLTFGYKAFQIAIVNGQWDLERVDAVEANALLSADKERKTLAPEVVEDEFAML